MTTATIFSSVPYNQNAGGFPPVPTPTVVNTGTPVSRATFTLTVSPATAWAKAATRGSLSGVGYVSEGEIFVAPNGTGTVNNSLHFPPNGRQYLTGEVLECAPGATASLTVTY